MAVKLIAVDMDGTFLKDDKTYNRKRFQAQYALLRQRGIHFVVASGNQFWQLQSFFPGIADDISFVAENGAWVISESAELFCGHIPLAQVLAILAELSAIAGVYTVVCGKETAWLHEDAPQSIFAHMSRHYRRLKPYHSVDEISDDIFKIALTLDDSMIPQVKAHLSHKVGETLTPVTSGFGFIDLIIPGIHKAHGVKLLQEKWGIADNEVVALGDSGNDKEMLAHAGFSFSMANASEEVKQVARYQTGYNNDEAVLDVIDQVLNHVAPFN